MGGIKLIYLPGNLLVSLDALVVEIERGLTFALYQDREDIILPSHPYCPHWISARQENDLWIVEVDDSFWGEYYLFDKMFSVFVYNLLDFGELRLLGLDISASSFVKQFSRIRTHTFNMSQSLLLGTVIKPYYQTAQQKVAMVESLVHAGLNIVKEDETYMVSGNQILAESQLIQSAIGSAGFYVPNITSYISDYHFMERLLESGVKVALINFLLVGLGSVFRLKQRFPQLHIWGHRIGYNAIKSLVSMDALATLSGLAGIDFLHIGTPKTRDEIEDKKRLLFSLRAIWPSFTAVFTKTTPEVLYPLVSEYGSMAVFMACGYFRGQDGISIDFGRLKDWVWRAKNASV